MPGKLYAIYQFSCNIIESTVESNGFDITHFFLTQVTTDSGNIKSHRVELKVETPEAFILADEEYHIDTGSSLSLVCIIEKATEPPQ